MAVDKSKLVSIASYLTTRTDGKKHGSYLVYADDKVQVMYDTYYPNVQVDVFIDGKRTLAAIYSGHGNIQEYHPGDWEKYILESVYPRVAKAKAAYEQKQQERKDAERQRKYGRLSDSSVFS